MNLKRIIREEINDFSASFYLIVSADEKFIYRRSYMGGMKWEKVDNLTPKEIVNSDFLTYKAANSFLERMEKGVAKVVSMDFILRKRDDNFPMMESNDMEWINDIQSNKDIAEELFNQTVITKDKGLEKFPFMTSNIHPKKYYFDISIKRKYGKNKDSDDIWERYKVLVNNRLKELRPKNLKESNDMGWVDESMPTLKDAFYNRFFKVGDIVTLSGKLVDLDHTTRIDTDNFKVKIEKVGNYITSSDFTPLQKEYWGHLGYMDEPLRFAEEDGDMLVVSIE